MICRVLFQIFLNISFTVPKGGIVGFIGENGAGKSTTIKLLLNIIKKDAGVIEILDKNYLDVDIRNDIGVVFDDCVIHNALYAKDINRIFDRIYQNWDKDLFDSLLTKFRLPKNMPIGSFSRGMKTKFSVICALSHHPKVLILDEVTSGLDPAMRADLLDLFLDFIQDEDHSIFFSTHIISDIEKVADYVLLIHNGAIIFQESKEDLLCKYGIARCYTSQFSELDAADYIAFEKTPHSVNCLIKNKENFRERHPEIIIDDASIEEIMLFYIKGEADERINN